MPEVGWAGLGIVPEVDSGFYRSLGNQVDPGLARVGKDSGKRFGGILGKSAALAAGGAVAAGFAAFRLGKDSVDQASDLNESLNAVNVTYGKQGELIQALGNSAAENFGLSNSEFNEFAVRFSAFAKTVGGDGFGVVRTVDDLTHRIADFASVMNLDVAEAAELFQSGLAGETEPLRRYGLDLSAAKVEAFALSEGIAKGKDELTESEKVQARYALLMKQTSKTQGDFKNTSDQLANQQRILTARWDDARAKLGTALLPVLSDVSDFLLDEGIPAFEKFSDWFTTDGIDGLKDFAKFTKNEVFPVVEDLGGFLKDAAGFGKDVVEFLNDLPDPAKYAALAALVGGVGAVKLRGGKGGALGTAGKVLGLAKPVPVFVTNKGFGAPGAPGGKTPPVVAPGGKPPIGTLPKLAPLIPIGLSSAPGQDSLLRQLTGFGLKGSAGDPTNHLNPGKVGDAEDYAAALADINGEFGAMTPAARKALEETARAFRTAKIPAELKTDIALNGVPESMHDVRALIHQYDLTPREKRTLFDLIGYDRTLDRIKRINAELDWAARPRQARINITKAYDAAGYETRGGLQEGSGVSTGPGRGRRMALGGFD